MRYNLKTYDEIKDILGWMNPDTEVQNLISVIMELVDRMETMNERIQSLEAKS